MRLEAYTADRKLAKALNAYATDTFGGATIVKGTGNSTRWGRERSYVVTSFTDRLPTLAKDLWINAIVHHIEDSSEDSVLVALDNEHLFVERTS